jgi:hypothetical protein
VIRKWQLVRVGLLRGEVCELFAAGALGGNFEEFRTLIHRCHRALGTDALRQAYSRFASTAGQIENVHAGKRARVCNERFGDSAAEGR